VQETSSCESSLDNPNQQEWKQNRGAHRRDQNENRIVVGAGTFGGIMSQREMEILTAWFPKYAQTLATVLRNRSQENESQSTNRFWLDRER
jgi:hypothetical protein